MEPTLSQVELYKHLFGRVADAYGEITTGWVTTVREPVTDALIASHLTGSRHLGFFLVDEEGMVDRGYIDVDISKEIFDNPKTTQEDLEEHWEAARSRVFRCACVLAAQKIEFYVETSRRRGFHLVVHASDPIPAGVMKQLLTAVTVEAQIKAEVFPKQESRNGPDSLGNFVFGMLQGRSVPAGKTVIVNWQNGFKPTPDSWDVLEGLKKNSLETIGAALAYLQGDAACNSFAPQGGCPDISQQPPIHSFDLLDAELIGVGFERCKVLDSYKWNARESRRLTTGDGNGLGEHDARIAVGNYCRAFEGGEGWAVDAIFRHLEDFDPTETRKQLASLKGNPPLCSKMCPGGVCDEMKAAGGGSSPIKFVYTDGRAHGFIAHIDAAPATATAVTPAVPKKRPPLFESLATLIANPCKPKWLVRGLIEIPATVLFFGPSGGGKTFVAADLAGASATDGKWFGRDVAGGPVFYIAGEGRTGLLRRFQAWQFQRGVMIPADRLFLSTARIEFDEKGALNVEEEVKRRTEEIGMAPALIVVDTLARALPCGADENSAKDMGAFINIADRIRDRFQCVVVIVHHAGVADDKRARGSTALKAAMDAELCITKRGAIRIAEWTKLKDLPDEPHPQEFALEKVLLGEGEDGEFITSSAVSWQGKAAMKTAVSTTKTENLGLETLRVAIAGGEKTTIFAWRPIFYAGHWGENDKAKKQAFQRVRESLVGKKLIKIEDGYYSIPRFI